MTQVASVQESFQYKSYSYGIALHEDKALTETLRMSVASNAIRPSAVVSVIPREARGLSAGLGETPSEPVRVLTSAELATTNK